MNIKPTGKKNYGSIGHLPCSRLGEGDHKVPEGMAGIATVKTRDKHDIVIVQEKLDGSNVGVALVDGKIYALGRSGYEAKTSPYRMHHMFHDWVYQNEERFRYVLREGERICGEWLTHAHGTMYELPHEPFVAFDIFTPDNKRMAYLPFSEKIAGKFVLPYLVHMGGAYSVQDALDNLGDFGKHGAAEQIEGAIWRVERNGAVDFLCKFVRPDKIDGKYLGDTEILNKFPTIYAKQEG